MRSPLRLLVIGAALAVAGAGCGGGPAPVDAATLLRDAKASIDSASAVHFTLTSQNVPSGSGTVLTGGHGDAVRPSAFSGTLSVVAAGFPLNVDVVSSGGVFYARSPLSTAYEKTDPAAYGFGDPAQLLDTTTGLSSLLTACHGAALAADDRLNGEQLAEVSCSMPGAQVAALLTSADPAQPVRATIGVTAGAHQLRRVTMVGPFFSKTQQSTFTVVLDNYGEKVSVTPPPT